MTERNYENEYWEAQSHINMLEGENRALREAHGILSGFSISSMFDAKGTYTRDKSDEWHGRLAQANDLLTEAP